MFGLLFINGYVCIVGQSILNVFGILQIVRKYNQTYRSFEFASLIQTILHLMLGAGKYQQCDLNRVEVPVKYYNLSTNWIVVSCAILPIRSGRPSIQAETSSKNVFLWGVQQEKRFTVEEVSFYFGVFLIIYERRIDRS